jgi:hypothetical protein
MNNSSHGGMSSGKNSTGKRGKVCSLNSSNIKSASPYRNTNTEP